MRQSFCIHGVIQQALEVRGERSSVTEELRAEVNSMNFSPTCIL